MDKVLILTILDESGSMGVKRSDVIGGFNIFLDKKKAHDFPCRMMVTKFNTICTPMKWQLSCGHESRVAPISQITHLTETTYTPGGMTALFDAIVETVKQADLIKEGLERVLCLIITDGEENSSKETTYEQVKDLIKEKTKQNWTFIYIGEQPEKWARQMNIPLHQTTSYCPYEPKLSFMTAFYYASSYCFNYTNADVTTMLEDAEKEAKETRNDWGKK